MNDRTDSWIDTALEDLAAADARVVVPPEIEAAVLHAWNTQHITRGAPGIRSVRGWRKAAGWVLVPATAAAIVAIVLLARDRETPPAGSPSAAHEGAIEGTAAAPAAPIDAGYVIVPEPFADTAALQVMRVRMARRALATLGMPLAEPDADGLVDVELLVGDDGVARSIRNATFVREGADRGAER